jgi:hypothetical protein
MAKCFELAAEVMRTDTGPHANQVRQQIGESCFDLISRPLLTQHDGAVPIQADDVERVLADINADAATVPRIWDIACSLSGCL